MTSIRFAITSKWVLIQNACSYLLWPKYSVIIFRDTDPINIEMILFLICVYKRKRYKNVWEVPFYFWVMGDAEHFEKNIPATLREKKIVQKEHSNKLKNSYIWKQNLALQF